MNSAQSGNRHYNKVFISYAREDREWAAEKARTFEGVGQAYFLDYESIRAGENWRDRLAAEIEAADLVWLIWSKYAAQSDWVRQEYEAALAKGDGGLRIDLLDSTPLPEAISHIQAERSPLAPPTYVTDRILREPTRSLPERNWQLPSVLLRPEYGVVPFVGREVLLEEYETWCEDDSPFAVRLLTGAGGVGKTRFAIEVCKRLRKKYWETAFVDRIELERYLQEPEAANNLMRLRRPTLLVVDYAETRRQQVQELFQAALHEELKQPVRVLLLARSEGEWWRELLKKSHDYEVLLGDGATPRPLPPLAEERETREDVYGQAVATFTRQLERPWPTFTLNLTDKTFDRVLFLHLAALAATYGQRIEERDVLLDFGVNREQTFWERKATDLELPPEQIEEGVLQKSATVLVLAGGCDRQALPQVLERVPDLAELTQLGRKRMGRVFAELYEVEKWVEPLQPDMLGERLVERVFADDEQLRQAWVKPSDPLELLNGLTVLNRVAARKAETEPWLMEIFECDLERSAIAAVVVAIANGDPIGRVLADYLLLHPNRELSEGLMEWVPHQTVALRELAATTTQQAMANEELGRAEQARLLNNQSNRLSELGRREEALETARESVEIYRELARTRPDAFLPDVAGSLNNFGTMLSELGRREEALEAAREAVALLLPFFERYPQGFMNWMQVFTRNYLERSEQAGREPDIELIAKIAAIFESLQSSGNAS
ncbi:MAG: TIR domain-containing protein [Cyanobacteria bacterium P01_D01_bin.123]